MSKVQGFSRVTREAVLLSLRPSIVLYTCSSRVSSFSTDRGGKKGMADLQAELARFEAELAGTAAPPGPPPVGSTPSTSLPGPPQLQRTPPAFLQHPPQPGWPGGGAAPNHPPAAAPQAFPTAGPSAAAYTYPAPAAQPVSGYFQQAAAAAPAYPYGAHTQPGIDSRKAELLTGIKAAFEQQKVSKKAKVGVARQAAGKKWVDPNLVEWPENDFRIFVGDLGNETNDDVLNKAFSRFPCFNKAKVVRDKKSNKTKGYGFVSFSDPIEGAKALREMDGKYIGNRPCKLRKSTWQERSQQSQPFMPGGSGGSKKKNHIGGVAKKPGILHK